MGLDSETPKHVTKVERIGSSAFRMLKVQLAPKHSLVVEPGCMASQDVRVSVQTFMNGGFFAALIMKYFGEESFFINYYINRTQSPLEIYFSQSTPGDIIERDLKNESLYIQPGALIARVPQVAAKVVWAGFSSWLGGEGLFRLRLEGTGKIWYGVYGGVIEKDVVGDYIVDSGHLLSYPPQMKLSIKLAGGMFSSIFSGEGLVLKLSGTGKIQLQTRSVKGLAQWLNPRFWG